MTIWIEGKNPTLYNGGISSWLFDLLQNLTEGDLEKAVLVVPSVKKESTFLGLELEEFRIPWFSKFPRKINHLIYDFVTFRLASSLHKPQLVFSPYYDVRISKKIPYIITIHDLCFLEVPQAYPKIQVLYFVRAMRKNIKKSSAIVTVSQSSKNAIISKFNVSPEKILVVPNRLNKEFEEFQPSAKEVELFREKFGNNVEIILYTGGLENRKNIPNLLKALDLLLLEFPHAKLGVTGQTSAKWEELLKHHPKIAKRTLFLGYLTNQKLKCAYLAADAVVYPSLSEGFGRSCLEAMSAGTPLACSNITVFREIAGNYPEYFEPHNPFDIAKALKLALTNQGIVRPHALSDNSHADLDLLRSILFPENLKL